MTDGPPGTVRCCCLAVVRVEDEERVKGISSVPVGTNAEEKTCRAWSVRGHNSTMMMTTDFIHGAVNLYLATDLTSSSIVLEIL